MQFEIGTTYTREEIGDELGGSHEIYLPSRDGRVTCGCFDPDRINPDAPEEILFGKPHTTPLIERAADMVFEQGQQGDAIPVFVKLHSNAWQYRGEYLCIGLTRDRRVVHRKMEQYPERGEFSGVLRFEKV